MDKNVVDDQISSFFDLNIKSLSGADILDGFDGDAKAVVKAHLDEIDPSVTKKPEDTDELRDQIARSAKKEGMPTADFIKEQLPDATELHAQLEGKILLDAGDDERPFGRIPRGGCK